MSEREFVEDLARQAGTLAIAALGTLRRELKPDQSIVTNIDTAVEAFVRRAIAESYPEDAFYGEESGGDPLAGRRVWVVDPIDGTTNLACGLPSWGVSIGLVEDGEPKAGAFYLPKMQDCFSFARGEGATLNGVRLKAEDRGPLQMEDPVGIGSEILLRTDLSGFSGRQRNTGSLTAHWCYVASGALRANVSVLEKLHDLAAAWGMVTEAGCVVEYFSGGEARLQTFLEQTTNRRPLLVGPPETLDRIRAVVRVPAEV